MKIIDIRWASLIYLAVVLGGCGEKPVQQAMDIPEEAQNLGNLTTYIHSQNPDTVLFRKTNTYGGREELYFRSMGDFTVDHSGRVYIADAASGEKRIYVYSEEGDYLNSLGGEGRGPGEFIGLCCLKVRKGRLFGYDYRQFKMNIYSIAPPEFARSVMVSASSLNISGETKTLSHDYFFLTDSTYLIGFSGNPRPANRGEAKYTDYYIANQKWEIISGKLFEQLQVREVWGEYRGIRIWKRFPFFKKGVLAVSPKGHIYRAETGDFLIEKYNSEGEYMGAFYYPYSKAGVTREDALEAVGNSRMAKGIAEKMTLPGYWPVINAMQFDDEDRLWVTTFTENREKLQWWVLDASGKLLARFMWKGKRAGQAHGLKEKAVIRNGFFYTRQENSETGHEEVVRYRIELTPSDKTSQ